MLSQDTTAGKQPSEKHLNLDNASKDLLHKLQKLPLPSMNEHAHSTEEDEKFITETLEDMEQANHLMDVLEQRVNDLLKKIDQLEEDASRKDIKDEEQESVNGQQEREE